MPRPDTSPQRRQEFAPKLARLFADLGYRRATTAALAQRCGVRENILYRLWPDKQAMFVAALDYVYDLSEQTWATVLTDLGEGESAAERLLRYEAEHHGEFGFYRIVFAGLSETDDPKIARAMKRLYGRFQRFVRQQIEAHRGAESAAEPAAELAAWAVLGLGTVANIGRELGLLSARARQRLIEDAGGTLLG